MPGFYPDIQAITTGTNSQQQISEKIRIPLPKSKSAISAGSEFNGQYLTKAQKHLNPIFNFVEGLCDFCVSRCTFVCCEFRK